MGASSDVATAAVRENRITSSGEASLRKRIGVGMGVGGLAAHLALHLPYALTSVVLAAAYGVWLTGRSAL